MTIRAPTQYVRPPLPFIQGHIQGRAGVPSGDKQFGAAGQWKTYDWPNPTPRRDAAYLLAAARSEQDVWSNRLLDLLKGKDIQFGGFGKWTTYDYPNPRGPQRAVDLLTFTNPIQAQLIGKDRQFRVFGQWTAYDYPNPRGPIPSVVLLSWSQGPKVVVPVIQAPFYQTDWPNPKGPAPSALTWTQSPVQTSPFIQGDWPNPRGPVQNYDLRTFLNALELTLIRQDKFFGAPGQAPANLDWPVPQWPKGSVDLGTWAQNLSQTTLAPAVIFPFSLSDWQNPIGYFFSYELRSIASGFSMLDAIPPAVIPPPPDVSTGGGASGAKRYRQPSWWGDEKKRKLEKKIEAVHRQIDRKREQVDLAPDLYRMQRLIEQIQELQRRLLKLLEQIDELNKISGDMEALEVYLVYRSLH